MVMIEELPEVLGDAAVLETEEIRYETENQTENIGDQAEYSEEIGQQLPVALYDNTQNSEKIINQLISLNQLTNEALEYQQIQQMSIWEKPLDKYTTGESLSVITLIIIVGVIIFKLIGGIIQCKI